MPSADTVTGTVAAAVERGTTLLAAAGVHDPRREALRLWSALAGSSPGAVWLVRGRTAPAELHQRFDAAVARCAAGEPLAYVTGRVGFRTLEVAVDRRVLIPRPETEGLVEHVLAWASRRGGGALRALDLGTGSGAIALSLAVEGPFREVVGIERSAAALEVARKNWRRVAPRTPVRFLRGSWGEPLGDACFDVVVANPPYLSDAEFDALEPAVRAYEPREALVGGADGLDPSRLLLRGAGRNLRHGGLLALELDCTRAEATLALARATGWVGARLERDLFGRIRYLLATGDTEP